MKKKKVKDMKAKDKKVKDKKGVKRKVKRGPRKPERGIDGNTKGTTGTHPSPSPPKKKRAKKPAKRLAESKKGTTGVKGTISLPSREKNSNCTKKKYIGREQNTPLNAPSPRDDAANDTEVL